MSTPFYTAIAAMTLDGKIAKDSAHPVDWTCSEDKRELRKMISRSDAIIVGHSTYKIHYDVLHARNCLVLTRSVETSAPDNPLGAYVNPAATNLKELIQNQGFQQVAVLGGAQTYAYCLAYEMIDELYLTIEPKIFGGGLSLFGEQSLPADFRLISTHKLNPEGSLLLHYLRI